MLQEKDGDHYRQDDHIGEEPRGEELELLLFFVKGIGHVDNEGDLGHFRWLEIEAGEPEPARCPFGRTADARDEDQQEKEQAPRQQGDGETPPLLVIDAHGNGHRRKADKGEGPLAFQEIEAVVEFFCGHHRRCGIDHDNPETGERHRHEEDYQVVSLDPLHGLPPTPTPLARAAKRSPLSS